MESKSKKGTRKNSKNYLARLIPEVYEDFVECAKNDNIQMIDYMSEAIEEKNTKHKGTRYKMSQTKNWLKLLNEVSKIKYELKEVKH